MPQASPAGRASPLPCHARAHTQAAIRARKHHVEPAESYVPLCACAWTCVCTRRRTQESIHRDPAGHRRGLVGGIGRLDAINNDVAGRTRSRYSPSEPDTARCI
eukprot:1959030-Rhodomonas_salina.7